MARKTVNILSLTQTVIECTECAGTFPSSGRPFVVDNETRAPFCGALCHHSSVFGVRPPITQEEDAALVRAKAWHVQHNVPKSLD